MKAVALAPLCTGAKAVLGIPITLSAEKTGLTLGGEVKGGGGSPRGVAPVDGALAVRVLVVVQNAWRAEIGSSRV